MSVITSVLQQTTPYRVGRFIGANIFNRSNGASVDLDITDTSSQPIDVQEGDLILAVMARGGSGDNAGSMTSTGYTKVLSIFENDTYDTNLDVFVKISDGTETNIISASTGNTADSVVLCAMVFRGVKEVRYARTTFLVNRDDVELPYLNNLNYGNIGVAIGAAAHAVGEAPADHFEQNGELEEYRTLAENDTNDVTLGIGIRHITNETGFFIGKLEMDGSTSSSSTCSAVLALV